MLNENEIIIHKNQTEMMDFMEDVNNETLWNKRRIKI